MRISIGRMLCWFGCLSSACAFAADVVTVVDVTGRTTTDAILREWSADQVIVQGESVVRTPVEDLLSVSFGHRPVPMVGGDPLVILANGDRLVLRSVSILDDVLTAIWHKIPSRPALKLPLETVAAIVFDLPAIGDDRQRLYAELQNLPAGEDMVLLANGDRVQGEFERLDGAFVQIKTAAGPLKLDRSRVRAIRMNPELTSPPKVPGRRLTLSLRDGSRVTLRSIELSDHELKCQTLAKLIFQIPTDECLACRVYGSHVIPLADREPAQVTFVPYLSHQWPLVRNANVLGGPLSIRGTEYSTGLGVHSRSVVTYDLQPTDREFRVTVGIDDAAGGAGSVRFGIELDGQRKWESLELNGRSPPVEVPPIKLQGAAKLMLIVDYGAGADIADYANWCDAVIVRE
ncbi:MAG: NPCBM/NEW2 domain-containing protein [Planctomycetes bacterium]|nr:NPCBM/NEW2 domain-containing protein [Planctomycetota bacterium]